MTTKKEIIEILKTENAEGLRIGNDVDGYEVLNKKETDAIIEQWAEARIEKELRKAESEAKLEQRQAILDRIGLTADEAKLLLG